MATQSKYFKFKQKTQEELLDGRIPEEFAFDLKDKDNHEWEIISHRKFNIKLNDYNSVLMRCKKCNMIVVGRLKDSYFPHSYIPYSNIPTAKQMTCDEGCIFDILT